MAASKTHPNGKPKKTRTKSAQVEAKAKRLRALTAAQETQLVLRPSINATI